VSPTLELDDIQGIVLRAYGDLRHATYVCLRIDDPDRARGWLRDVAELVTPAAKVVDKKVRGVERVNIALSYAGMATLGLDEDALTTFPGELQEGMDDPERSRVLGDTDTSAPQHWHFGVGSPPVDILLMLYAGTDEGLTRLEKRELERLRGVACMHIERTAALPDAKEHFGFTDGIAQPTVRGDRVPQVPGQAPVPAGEFVLGYANDYDKLPWTPTVAGSSRARAHGLRACRADGPHAKSRERFDLGRNGTYLVLRKLEQDVDGFWNYFRARAAEIAAPSEVGDVATWLAAKCVGRWPSGAPLVLAPHQDDAGAAHPARRDDFTYADDPEGLRCPFGAHIRRSNPRDSRDRVGGGSISDVSPRRILRRGRTYVAADGSSRGVLFAAMCANVRRQFEFVQQTWLGNRRFATLEQDPDPLVGGGRSGDGFTVPARPFRYRLPDLPRFVTTRGGGYFFMPGLRALRFLAD
jgi:Dyp-type peroxidase family